MARGPKLKYPEPNHIRGEREAREYIANNEARQRERTGIRTLKLGYNTVYGYYIEVTDAAVATREREEPGFKLPDDYRKLARPGNGTRYTTPRLQLAQEILGVLDSNGKVIYNGA